VVSKDGRLLATVSEGAVGIQVWETGSGFLKLNLRSRAERVADLNFSPDARRLAAVGDLGPEGGDLIEIWDLANPDTSLVFGGHKDGISMIAFSPDGDTLASASVDNTIKLWSLSRQCEIATLRGHREGVMGVAFSPDGKTLASASGDRSCKLWNLPTRREIAWFRHTIGLLWAGFSPDGRCFGYRCDHGQIMLLRCPSVADIDAELKLAQRKEAKPEHNASDSGS